MGKRHIDSYGKIQGLLTKVAVNGDEHTDYNSTIQSRLKGVDVNNDGHTELKAMDIRFKRYDPRNASIIGLEHINCDGKIKCTCICMLKTGTRRHVFSLHSHYDDLHCTTNVKTTPYHVPFIITVLHRSRYSIF